MTMKVKVKATTLLVSWIVTLCIAFHAISTADAFLPSIPNGGYTTRQVSYASSSSSLRVGDDLFENFKRLWGDAFGEEGNSEKGTNYSDDDAAGTTLIASIPVQSIKPGGLRLFLMFYLMGMQNTPDRGSWQANQPASSASDEYVVEMYYHDATAMLSVELLEEEIRIQRCGSVPSTSYLMQESVIVQGILDELQQCAFDENVPVADRLLAPKPSNAIEMARGLLSFG